ncbi:DUF7507 domain-containing protein [Angustibacter sp. McL0619]|uniref:DUF7507 domain-containing protein n=1 Tax=Angustibacter sp. McL0619 TaxID=3415676 RepID=UPI003CF5B277
MRPLPRWRRLLAALLVVALSFALGAIAAVQAAAAVEAPLSLVFNQQVYGDALMGGNAVLVCPAGNTDCTSATNRQGTQSSGINNNFYMTQTGANAANGWFNSSSINPTIPAGASIAYARLLWAGDTGLFRTGTNTTVNSRCDSNNSPAAVQPPGAADTAPVQLTVGNKATVSVTASRFTTDKIANVAVNQPQYYSAAANVTPLFAGVPTGSPLTITAANVWTPAGFGCMGGWSLVLVYAYPQADPTHAPTKREVFVYDGHVRQNSSDPATTTTVSGFRVSGQANVGVVAYEGDWGLTGDQFSINGTAQTDPGLPNPSSSNFFTSYAQFRTPSQAPNNFSVDSKQFAVSPTVIKPGDTSASLSFSTSGDSYLAQELVMSVPIPTLQITKTASPTTVHPGDTVTYTITVTNPTVGSTATNVVVNDPLTPACNRNIGSLTGSMTYQCTGTAGSSSFTNVANVTGTDAQSDALSGTAQAPVTVLNPSITITKTTDQPGYRVGATVTYTITVNNTGNANLTSVAVTDGTTASCARTIGNLAAGATTSYTCTAIAPVTGNSNTATVSGSDSLNRTVNASATVPVPVIRPALTLVKSAAPTTATAAGQIITYSFRVTNSGDSTVSSISIADTLTAPAGPVPAITCPVTSLAAAASTTCTGTYPVTQADVDNGAILDSAVANGVDIAGGAVASSPSAATVTVTRSPALSVSKTASPANVSTAGQSIAYSFVVTNTGNVTVHGISIADVLAAPAGPVPTISCPATTLSPGAATTCTATYSTTQNDIDHGSVTNTATASGFSPTNAPVTSGSSTASVSAASGASLALVKTASPTVVTAAGQPVAYSFKVTNTGNLTVTGLSIADTFTAPSGPAPNVTCPVTQLAPNATTTCTASYSATQADIDNGTILNAAIAHATDAQGHPVASAQSNASVSVTATPRLDLTKTASRGTVTAAGQQVTYTFVVTNRGNVTIRNVAIADTFTSPAGPTPVVSCPATTLVPGTFTSCTATYTATQADIDNGTIRNSAVAQGSDPSGSPVSSPAATATVTAPATATLSLVKTATPTTVTALGQQVSYQFLATNTGNVTLSSVGITDSLAAPATPPLVISCPPAALAPSASTRCTATYTVGQADIDNGSINNTATARAVSPTGATVTSNSSTAAVTVDVTSALTLHKAASPTSISGAGQNVSYTFTVTNSGQTTISTVGIDDPMFTGANAPACAVTTLAPGATAVCTASYTSTQADMDRGSIRNTATAGGTTPQGGRVTSAQASATVTASTTPGLLLTKSASPASFASQGSTITYTFTVVNTGNVTVAALTINDTLAAPAGPQLDPIVCGATNLAPAASTTCTATYLTRAADVDNGSISNAATAAGSDPGGNPVTSNQSTATVSAITNAALSLTKTASPTTITHAGQTVTFTFAVTNSGNQTVTTIAITDINRAPAGPLSGPVTCAATSLAAGASTTCTATYIASQADQDHGSIADTAVASGLDPGGNPVSSNASTAIVTVIQSPALSVVKTAAPTTVNGAGQRVTYSFVVTNRGNVTITGVSIADSFSGPAGPPATPVCPNTTLPPGGSLTCTASYTATQADVDNGRIENTATASGTDPNGGSVTAPPDTATVTITQSPAMSLTKTAEPATVSTAGEVVDYTFTVRNTGNLTLAPISVDDTLAPPAVPALSVTCPKATLPPGASTACTASHTVTQADLDNGSVSNSAIARSSDPSGDPVSSNPSTATVGVARQASLTLVKSATPGTITTAGQTVTYAFLVTNTGNLTVTGIVIRDTLAAPASPQLAPISCPVTTLAPNASTTCSATYTSLQADVDHGSIDNSATAAGQDPSGSPVVSAPSTASVDVSASPSLVLSKTVTPTTYDTLGQSLTYTFTVTNDGNVTVGALAVADPMFTGADAATCAVTTLAPTAQTTCTARHTVTQADLDAGSVQNTATARGTEPAGGTITSPPSSATASANLTPTLSLVKTATPTTISAAGVSIAYTFRVTNTGNVTIDGLSIADAFTNPAAPTGRLISCAATTLAPGAATNCTTSYTATQADIDNGSITNTATASGTDPAGNPVSSQPSTAAVAVTVAAGLIVVKSATPATITAAGQAISYTFSVTNTGNVTMSLLSINDTLAAPAAPPLTVSCPQRTIAPHANVTCTAPYTATQADIDNGSIANTATASAQTPTGTTIVSPPSSNSVAVDQDSALTLTKTASRSTVTAPGQVIDYTFTVTNSGNVSIDSIAVADPMFTDANAPVCAALSLAPQASTTCTATHTTTQADIDSGAIRNTAVADGRDAQGTAVASDPATAIVTASQNPTLQLVKSALSQALTTVGQSVTYSFRVTNTGNVTVTDLTIDDALVAPAVCPVTVLAPVETTTCLATYTSTQADFDNGTITNTATAKAVGPQGAVESNPSSAIVTADANLELLLQKRATPTQIASAGQQVFYRFTVTNAGNVTIHALLVDDVLVAPAGPALTPDCAVTTLASGESTTCSATYVATQADVDNGIINNSATVTGLDPGNTAVTSNLAAAAVVVNQTASLSLAKSADPTTVDGAGQPITYTFTVVNTGNVTVDSLAIADPPLRGANAPNCAPTSIAPGATSTCTATYSTTQADIDNGTIRNTAVAEGLDPAGGPVSSPQASATVDVVQSGGLELVKSASSGGPVAGAGASIAYEFALTNTGNVSLTSLSIADSLAAPAGPALTVTCPTDALAPGSTASCTASYTVTQADVDNGSIDNQATAAGVTPSSDSVESNPSTASVPIAQAPALTLVKSVTPQTAHDAGDRVSYTFAVTNSGDTTITDLVIDDTPSAPAGPLTPITCPAITLAPGEGTECTASYVLTQADVDHGTVDNSASAAGAAPGGGTVTSNTSTATVTVTAAAALSLTKSATPTTVSQAGATVSYGFIVTNTGNVTVDAVAIDDTFEAPAGPPLASIDCGSATLAPNDSTSCTATYTVTQADVDHGQVRNSAHATALDPAGDPVLSADDTATVTIPADPALTLVKAATRDSVSAVGDVIDYEFLVTNIGNDTIGQLAIDDLLAAPAAPALTPSCPVSSLAPSASTTCTASYTVTQADLDSGAIDNTATVTGVDPHADPVTSNESSAAVSATQSPALTLTKTATPATVTQAGQNVAYQFLATNTGNVTVTGLTILDTLTPPAGPALTIDCPATTLAPSTSTTCTADYVVIQADIDHGSIDNSAVAEAVGPAGQQVSSDPSAAVVDVTPASALTLTKSASPTTVARAGLDVTYTFRLTNTGNVTLSGVSVTDTFTAPAGPEPTIVCPDAPLAPGDTTSCTSTYPVTQADVDHGSIDNSAVASAVDPTGAGIVSPASTAHVAAPASPSLALVKSSPNTLVSTAGESVTYEFLVTNTGNVTMQDVVITDTFESPAGPALTPVCPTTPLPPAASMTCTADYVVTQADIDHGMITNTATADATDPNGTGATADPSTAVIPVFAGPPAITLVKQAVVDDTNDNAVLDVGDQVTWTFLVTNTGQLTLDISVQDSLAGPVTCPVTTLAPNGSTTCSADRPHVLDQADFDAGFVTNTATATGTATGGNPVISAPSSATVPLPDSPGLELVKQAQVTDTNGDGVAGVGDSLRWIFQATNTGNTTLTDIAVHDELAGPVSCPTTTVAPGRTVTCSSAPQTITAAQAAAGSIVNTASATGTSVRGGSTVTSATASAEVFLEAGGGSGGAVSEPGSGLPFTGVQALRESVALGLGAVLLGVLLILASTHGPRRRDEA